MRTFLLSFNWLLRTMFFIFRKCYELVSNVLVHQGALKSARMHRGIDVYFCIKKSTKCFTCNQVISVISFKKETRISFSFAAFDMGVFSLHMPLPLIEGIFFSSH